jgi:hypothetical protein
MKLAEASFLRTFAAEHGAYGVKPCDRIGGKQIVFNVGADNGRRGFRALGQKFVVAVAEGVHFLFDDIGGFPDAALE